MCLAAFKKKQPFLFMVLGTSKQKLDKLRVAGGVIYVSMRLDKWMAVFFELRSGSARGDLKESCFFEPFLDVSAETSH